jgi:diguanylate cyclase (GGDEF)-like protein
VRAADTVARWGGEEFAVILPHTDLAGATRAAECVRAAVSRLRVPMPDGTLVDITASVGVAAAPGSGGDPDVLYAVADQALYEAKRQGKDRVAVASPGVHVRMLA